jgi:hypothetical protein
MTPLSVFGGRGDGIGERERVYVTRPRGGRRRVRERRAAGSKVEEGLILIIALAALPSIAHAGEIRPMPAMLRRAHVALPQPVRTQSGGGWNICWHRDKKEA